MTRCAIGAHCLHGKAKRHCAICTPCPCTASAAEANRRRQGNCADCNPCQCSKDLDPGSRRRQGSCVDCNPCACTGGLPTGQWCAKRHCRTCNGQRVAPATGDCYPVVLGAAALAQIPAAGSAQGCATPLVASTVPSQGARRLAAGSTAERRSGQWDATCSKLAMCRFVSLLIREPMRVCHIFHRHL